MNSIQSILEVLKKKVSHGSTYIQRNYNEYGVATFKFNPRASTQEINDFHQQFQQTLPQEYTDFLTIHNGCEIFVLADGRGVSLYSLEKVYKETINSNEEGILSELKDDFWVIGEMNDGAILINRTTLAHSKDIPYMEWCYAVGIEETADTIGKNFKDFLKYTVISQGDLFWEWSTTEVDEEDYTIEANSEDYSTDGHSVVYENPYSAVEIKIEYPYEKISPYRLEISGIKDQMKTVLSSFESEDDFPLIIEEILEELNRWETTEIPIHLIQCEVRSLLKDQQPRKEELSYNNAHDFLNSPPQIFLGR